jgi:plastocyanin
MTVNLIIRQNQSHFMKRGSILCILVIVLAAACGCTQTQTQTPAPETTAAPVSPTEFPATIPAAITTPEPATVQATVSITAAALEAATATITTATTRPSMTPSTKITTIHIRNNTFVPDQLTVLPGTGITWINDDSVAHVVKAIGDSQGKFTSSEMIRDAHFGYTFGEATGTFEFGDPAYPAMKGAIIVKKGDSVVGGSPIITASSP